MHPPPAWGRGVKISEKYLPGGVGNFYFVGGVYIVGGSGNFEVKIKTIS